MICHEDGIDEDSIHLETVFSISTSPESITNGRIQLKHTYPKAANLKKKVELFKTIIQLQEVIY